MVGLLTGADAALERLVRVVLEHTRPELILLFGSRACGAPRDDSDYDLMLVVATPDMVKPARDETSNALRDAGFTVDVLVCTIEEYERRQHDPGLVTYKIAREGRVLYATGRLRQYTPPSRHVREHPPREGVRWWLDRAEMDLEVAERAFAAEPPAWPIICFNAHQYAEKTLKALIAAHGVHPLRTHELEKLLALLPSEIRDIGGLANDCKLLTDLYPRSRYPDAGPDPTADEGRAALTAPRRIRDRLWAFVAASGAAVNASRTA